MSFLRILLGAAIVAGPAVAGAQSLHCGNYHVFAGDPVSKLSAHCDAPVSKSSFCKPLDPPQQASQAPLPVVCRPVEDWIYKPAPGEFMTTLRIEEGKVVSVTYGDRVK